MNKRLTVHPLFTPDQLSDAAAQASDPRIAKRILAIRYLLLGHTCPAAATAFGCSPPAIQDWVHRYNAEGLPGLADRPRSGRRRLLPADQEEAFKTQLRAAPPPGRATWHADSIRTLLKDQFGADYTPSGVYFLLHRIGFEWLAPRPQHPQSDPAAQAAFKKTSPHS